MIRTRIAPSPTGNLHIGTARTALFNYLFARKMGGKFILRIEDTDLERSDKKYEKNILAGLKWLGIEADEGPEEGGDYGPYRQSERLPSYKTYLEKLLQEKKAFYCFHSEAELEEERNQLLKAKNPPVHFCEYRGMDLREAEDIKDIKKDYIIRFKNHAGRKVSFSDLIRGEMEFESDLIGDFSLAKDLDTPLYNFAVVIDDQEMKISHVIRGEDHLPNTPKQLLLIEALDLQRPQYAHLPLILGSDRSKMSKRHGATSVDEYREAGYLPEVLFNFMALLGWNPGGEQEIFSREELIEKFSLDEVHKSGAVFDITKLDWMNGEYIRQKSVEELVKLCKPYLKDFPSKPDEYLAKVISLEQPRLKKLSELAEKAGYFFREPEYEKELLRWKKMTDEEIKQSLEKSLEILQDNQKTEAEKIEKIFLDEAARGGDRGKLLWPLRAALSGQKASAGPFEILKILGVGESIRRLNLGVKKIS